MEQLDVKKRGSERSPRARVFSLVDQFVSERVQPGTSFKRDAVMSFILEKEENHDLVSVASAVISHAIKAMVEQYNLTQVGHTYSKGLLRVPAKDKAKSRKRVQELDFVDHAFNSLTTGSARYIAMAFLGSSDVEKLSNLIREDRLYNRESVVANNMCQILIPPFSSISFTANLFVGEYAFKYCKADSQTIHPQFLRDEFKKYFVSYAMLLRLIASNYSVNINVAPHVLSCNNIVIDTSGCCLDVKGVEGGVCYTKQDAEYTRVVNMLSDIVQCSHHLVQSDPDCCSMHYWKRLEDLIMHQSEENPVAKAYSASLGKHIKSEMEEESAWGYFIGSFCEEFGSH